MEIEKQVTSKELSMELEKNGYPQKGLFWWCKSYWGDGTMERWDCVDRETHERVPFEADIVAPTVAELGEQLLLCCSFDRMLNGDFMCTMPFAWKEPHVTSAKTEADCRAKMWLYLKQKGLLNE